MRRRPCRSNLVLLIATHCVALPAMAQEHDAAELAKQLSNPVAALISVPLQYNHDLNIGPERDGERSTLNIQPVIPVEINEKWNLISRTIVPLISQRSVFPGAGSQSGTGDIVASAFLSPKAATSRGWIWGAGPVLLLPSGSDDLLTSDKWGAGPTGLVLKQQGGWTYGALANHIWSFAGSDTRADVNATFLQPFLAYGTKTAWTYTVNLESTYDWEGGQWSVPVHVLASKVTRIGGQLVSIGGGLRYWADGPEGAPHDLGFRIVFTLLYPN